MFCDGGVKLFLRHQVCGSGPGGLICAGYLIQAGNDVTIFEALHKAGGVLVYGIPEFRPPKAIVQHEVEYLQKLGVEFKTDFVVGKTRTIGQLMSEDGYDAVSIGVGADNAYIVCRRGDRHPRGGRGPAPGALSSL